jgi:hypothetical protein
VRRLSWLVVALGAGVLGGCLAAADDGGAGDLNPQPLPPLNPQPLPPGAPEEPEGKKKASVGDSYEGATGGNDNTGAASGGSSSSSGGPTGTPPPMAETVDGGSAACPNSRLCPPSTVTSKKP